jgi:hypothetical protein
MSVSTLVVPQDRILLDVRPGDAIIEIDGRALAIPSVVNDRPYAMANALGLVNRLGTETIWNFYPDTHCQDDITVQRDVPAPAPAPAPARRRRPATRIIGGVRFTYDGVYWYSEDGRWEIRYDADYETECDEKPHPMRLTATLYQDISERPWLFPVEATMAVYAGASGYLCPGSQQHFYARWSVWDNTTHDYLAGSGPGAYGTFTEAARDLEGRL